MAPSRSRGLTRTIWGARTATWTCVNPVKAWQPCVCEPGDERSAAHTRLHTSAGNRRFSDCARQQASEFRRLGPVLCSVLVLVTCFVLVAVSPAIAAQDRVETLLLESFRFEHQPASEALSLIEPLLSSRGTVSVDREKNTVLVRDHPSVVGQMRPLLEEFDHPRRLFRLEVYLLEARRGGSQPQEIEKSRRARSELPADIADSLGDLLAFRHYESLGSASVVVREGQTVVRDVGALHQLSFRAGTILLGQRLPLHSFELRGERSPGKQRRLFHADLNLKSDKALLLTVSADRQSQSGVVLALQWRPIGQVSPPIRE